MEKRGRQYGKIWWAGSWWMLALLWPLGLSAQTVSQAVCASAGGATQNGTIGKGGERCAFYWSMGEPIVETETGSKKILTQGFWQSEGYIRDTIEVDTAWQILGIEAGRLLELVCYPNPTDGPLQVQLKQATEGPLTVGLCLTDVQGRLLCRKTVHSWPWRDVLDLSAYPAGTYVLTLFLLPQGSGGSVSAGQRIKSYKIIKY